MSRHFFYLGYGGSSKTDTIEKHKFKTIQIFLDTRKIGFEFISEEVYENLILKGYKTQLESLEVIYKKWLDTFPFKHPLIELIEDTFTKKPFLIYDKKNVLKLSNDVGLAETLLKINDAIFRQINANTLYDSGYIKDLDVHLIELILERRKIETHLGIHISKNNTFILSILDWLQKEKDTWNELIPFIQNIENKKSLPPQPNIKPKTKYEAPKTFDELFYNTKLVTPCIDILKELDPPLIDTDCNYIGKLKGVICVWIEEMQRQGIVRSSYPEQRKLLASLIPQKIKRFYIDESMFGKYQNKAENLYRTDIKTKVSKIKLSQNSH